MKHVKQHTVTALRWSEQYTKIDMVYFAGNGFWLLLAQGVAMVSAFFVIVILTRVLSPEVFGQYRFVLSIVAILTIFTLPGTGVSLTRAVARGAQVNLSNIAKAKVYWGCGGAIAALLIALYYYMHGNIVLACAFCVAALFIPLYEAYFVYSFYYRGKQDFKTPALYEALSTIGAALVSIITVLYTDNLYAVIAAFFFGKLATRYFYYRKTLRKQTLTIKKTTTDDTIEYGKKLSAIGIVGVMAENLDKIMVWHFLGAEALALYITALAIPLSVAQVFEFVPQLFLPKFSKKEVSLLPKKTIGMYGISLIIIAGLYAFFIPMVYVKIFPAFGVGQHALLFSGLIIIALPIRAIIGQMYTATKKYKYVLWFAVSKLLSQCVWFFVCTALINDIIAAATAAFALQHITTVCVQLLFSGPLLRS